MSTLDHHPPVADIASRQERLTPPTWEQGHDPRAGAEVATSMRISRAPVCATCGAAFATDGALQRHLLDAYHGFQCLRCGALFGQPSALDVHCLLEHRTPPARPYARAQSTDEAWSDDARTAHARSRGDDDPPTHRGPAPSRARHPA